MMDFTCHNFEDKIIQIDYFLFLQGRTGVKFQPLKLPTPYPAEVVRLTLTKARIQSSIFEQ